MLSCFKNDKRYIHILNRILNLVWLKWMSLILKQQYVLSSYTASTMSADTLANLGVSASACMILTPNRNPYPSSIVKWKSIEAQFADKSIVPGSTIGAIQNR